MSSPIRSLSQSRPAPRQRAAQAASSNKSSRPPAQPPAASRASDASAASADVLTEPEQQMIARQFPDAPELSMRLYGPGRSSETIQPGAVGSRLDVQV